MEIEQLWGTLARKSRNIVPVLDFLLSLGTHTAYQVRGCHQQQQETLNRCCIRPPATLKGCCKVAAAAAG